MKPAQPPKQVMQSIDRIARHLAWHADKEGLWLDERISVSFRSLNSPSLLGVFVPGPKTPSRLGG